MFKKNSSANNSMTAAQLHVRHSNVRLDSKVIASYSSWDLLISYLCNWQTFANLLNFILGKGYKSGYFLVNILDRFCLEKINHERLETFPPLAVASSFACQSLAHIFGTNPCTHLKCSTPLRKNQWHLCTQVVFSTHLFLFSTHLLFWFFFGICFVVASSCLW